MTAVLTLDQAGHRTASVNKNYSREEFIDKFILLFLEGNQDVFTHIDNYEEFHQDLSHIMIDADCQTYRADEPAAPYHIYLTGSFPLPRLYLVERLQTYGYLPTFDHEAGKEIDWVYELTTAAENAKFEAECKHMTGAFPQFSTDPKAEAKAASEAELKGEIAIQAYRREIYCKLTIFIRTYGFQKSDFKKFEDHHKFLNYVIIKLSTFLRFLVHEKLHVPESIKAYYNDTQHDRGSRDLELARRVNNAATLLIECGIIDFEAPKKAIWARKIAKFLDNDENVATISRYLGNCDAYRKAQAAD